MKTTFCGIIIPLLFLASTGKICAQGGGPPMITDDPGTPGVGEWEINASINSETHGGEKEMEAPLLDINYGLNERTQLRIEMPYLLTKVEGESLNGRQGDVGVGVKYRFLDEDEDYLSFSMYPAVVFSTTQDSYNEYALPVQLEKTFGKWVLGAQLGYSYVEDDQDYFIGGFLVGYGFSTKFEAMGEVDFQMDRLTLGEVEPGTVVNFGIRYELNQVIRLIASMGTGISAPKETSKIDFISFAGFQFTI
jgi:Putative MetA-pathway of phenol degradation